MRPKQPTKRPHATPIMPVPTGVLPTIRRRGNSLELRSPYTEQQTVAPVDPMSKAQVQALVDLDFSVPWERVDNSK